MSIRLNTPIDEPSINVYPSLATELGINKAIIVCQIQRIITTQPTTESLFWVDNQAWVWNSIPSWQSIHFQWLSENSIARLLRELENDNIVHSRPRLQSPLSNIKSYRVNQSWWNAHFAAQSIEAIS